MPIESEMRALTEALNKHTDALNSFVKNAGKGGSGGGTADAGTKPAGTKPAGTKPGAGPKKIKAEDVQKKFGEFLATTDAAERKERVGIVKKINAHFEVAKMTEADPTIWPEAFKVLDRVIEGEDVDDVLAELGGGDGEDGDGEDSVV